MNFIGIDLAWTYKNETGICVINENGEIELCEARNFSDQDLASLVKEYAGNGAIVAIDAPLVVKNETGSRECDRVIMKQKIHERNLSVFTCSRQYLINTYGSVRGEQVVAQIRGLMPEFVLTTDARSNDFNIIETFPTGICLGLFPEFYPIKYKLKKDVPSNITKAEMGRMIDALSGLQEYPLPIKNSQEYFGWRGQIERLSKAAYKNLEDKVDAFLCAYAAYWLKNNDGQTFGTLEDGFIMLPVKEYDMLQGHTHGYRQSTPGNGINSNLYDMVEAVRQFHVKNGFDIGTESQATMLYRMNLMMEELGEISQCLTKGKGNLAEEHADLLILLLGNCLTMDIDIVDAFWTKFNVIMARQGKKVGQFDRVSDWRDA